MIIQHDEARKNQLPALVVIGASAGGLEALYSFFKTLGSDTGCAFIIVQHLSPDFKSMMDEILSNHTHMKVVRVDSSVPIEPNTVYLIAPGTDLICYGATLDKVDREASQRTHAPIDILFESAAAHYSDRVIGIVLSGTGTDGTRGAKTIKENGGIVIAQTIDTCKFDGMPRNIIAQGLADRILPPEDIPEFIGRVLLGDKSSYATLSSPETKSVLQKILQELNSRTGMDFTDYRQTTIMRRIERRMVIVGCHNLDEYLTYIKTSSSEAQDLSREMLIGVTQFFRDRDVFNRMRSEVIPEIVKNSRENDTIRVWSVGCSTGEEAYSIAILFLDYFDEHNITRDLKIFATDIDHSAVQTASNGTYPESIRFNIDSQVLAKYFVHSSEKEYTVSARLRKCVMFAVHNVLSDPPFTRIDLVTCRNLLIYFQPHLQTKVITYLDFSLKIDGYLLLGISESIGPMVDRYSIIDGKQKIFQKRADILSRAALEEKEPFLGYPPLSQRNTHASRLVSPHKRLSELQVNRILDSLVEKNLPPCFIITEDLSLIYVFASAKRFLNVGIGKTDFNAGKMLPKELGLGLTAGINRAMVATEDVNFGVIPVEQDGLKIEVTMKIQKLTEPRVHPAVFAVYIKETSSKGFDTDGMVVAANSSESGEELLLTEATQSRMLDMEQQLKSTKEALQSTIEELEATNEELQSANEELLSSNEELQSTNEELHSVNEELYTVNAEHQRKIQEIVEAKSDFEHLLTVSKTGALFVDNQRKVRRFTSKISSLINIVTHDIGRAIDDLAFSTNDQEIKKAIVDCLQKKSPQYISLHDHKVLAEVSVFPHEYAAHEDLELTGPINRTLPAMHGTKMNGAVLFVREK